MNILVTSVWEFQKLRFFFVESKKTAVYIKVIYIPEMDMGSPEDISQKVRESLRFMHYDQIREINESFGDNITTPKLISVSTLKI